MFVFFCFFVLEFIADSTNDLRPTWRPVCHFLPLPFIFSVQSILELNVAVAGLWACTAPQIFLRLYAWILLFDIHMYQCHLCMVTNAIIYLCYKLYVMCGRLPWHQLMSLWIKNKNKFHVRFCHQVLQEEKKPECSQICLRASLLTANAEFIGKKKNYSFILFYPNFSQSIW